MKLDVRNLDGSAAGSIDLPEGIFGLEVRKDILARMVNYQLAKRRAGTHKTKGRSEIKATTAPRRSSAAAARRSARSCAIIRMTCRRRSASWR